VNCYECAKIGHDHAAVGICKKCGAGLCPDHARETARYRVAGTLSGCPHDFREPSGPSHGGERGVARSGSGAIR
jgi:hypothetical protein